MIGCKIERRLAYPAGFLFALVTDIEAYPSYMPGWRAVRVLRRTPGQVVVEQIVSLGGVRVRFCSTADADPPRRLEIRTTDPPFRCFRILWQFTAAGPAETVVQAGFDMAFRSSTLEHVAAPVLPVMLRQVVAAFERRAAQRFRRAAPAPGR
jgi:coenzyme Q-binding protein COQ10